MILQNVMKYDPNDLHVLLGVTKHSLVLLRDILAGRRL